MHSNTFFHLFGKIKFFLPLVYFCFEMFSKTKIFKKYFWMLTLQKYFEGKKSSDILIASRIFPKKINESAFKT